MAGENRRVRVRMSLWVEFDHPAAKAAFNTRLEYIRSLLTPPGLRSLDNHGLLTALFDLVEGSVAPSFPSTSLTCGGPLLGSRGCSSGQQESADDASVVQSFNSNAGKLHAFHSVMSS